MNMSGLYAMRGIWKQYFENEDTVLEQPYRVFWHKDNYYDWNECRKLGVDLTNTAIYLRSSRDSQERLIKCARDIVWKIPTKTGELLVHCNEKMIEKKDLLNEIRKRKKRLVSLITTRNIGVLGFKVASYV